jgi:glutamate-1-semialdehyde 2,1-aminomutase
MSRSEALHRAATALLPGGTSRLHYYYQPHPIYAARGLGCRLVDVDGVERLDFLNNFTAMLHGHADPDVNAAIIGQLQDGTAWSEPGEAEIRLAALLAERVPSLERMRFANSGTEAVMLAVKLAREFTGRAKLAKFEGHYHGYYDYVQVSVATPPGAWGDDDTPASVASSGGLSPAVMDDVVVLPWNDREATARLLEQHGRAIAALILDPAANRGGIALPEPGFLDFLAQLTRQLGIVLIYDEVISFRLAYGGAQQRFGARPDLTTLGKVIGGGLPIGAVGGRADIMAMLDPSSGRARIESGGTFSGNPLSMVAGIAALSKWTPEAVDRLNALGATLRARVDAVFADAGEAAQLAGDGSLFRLMLTRAAIRNYRVAERTSQPPARMAVLHHRLMQEGIIVSRIGLGCLSTPMGEAEVDAFVSAVRRAVREPLLA